MASHKQGLLVHVILECVEHLAKGISHGTPGLIAQSLFLCDKQPSAVLCGVCFRTHKYVQYTCYIHCKESGPSSVYTPPFHADMCHSHHSLLAASRWVYRHSRGSCLPSLSTTPSLTIVHWSQIHLVHSFGANVSSSPPNTPYTEWLQMMWTIALINCKESNSHTKIKLTVL
jgi:hypothetical protein